ncbi:MAG TPA: DUF402 domain-containing protein [Thermomicrobiaceae bacterium]|nr:DUF402 domain-containing protein [Thermomicrobiaceae bacterium]
MSDGPREALAPGAELSIVKLRPDGSEAARYPGTTIASPPGWVAVAAVWEHGNVDVGAFAFANGDRLQEYFSLHLPYNAFAVWSSEGRAKGWYCNVTYPSRLDGRTLYWHDLYVDVLVDAGGVARVVDEDELAASGLPERDPELARSIQAARDDLLAMIAARAYPFSELPPGRH